MASCDADCRFNFVDIGSPGADGDMNVFARTKLGKCVLESDHELDLPNDLNIDGQETPLFFIADDAFPLTRRIMKPYGGHSLTNEQKVFNYRLSRARRTIENAFGIMSMRWGCLRSEFLCHPEKAKLIVAACCALHNFLMKRSPTYGVNPDRYDAHGNLIEGDWRKTNQPLDQIETGNIRSTEIGKVIRQRLTNFFNNTDVLHYQRARAYCIDD